MPDAFEYGRERVVIGLRYRVELVVMAAGATHRQAEKGAAGGADHVVQFIRSLVGRQHWIGAFDPVIRTGD